ncbi:MAG TPA: excinuclease ABC subunit UvrA [Pyrinomonadaceae bacterium]|nr:excinuclease ABC subunit UvrA [Chloracidobacterium sp.]HRJ88488.1 excinuclease ABC subunit UvrA [Pyrinomonadaceae bacterium]HRK50571.1 excinuclease ABC subunit UvrA [Pyrinomonadaceae bacterium]
MPAVKQIEEAIVVRGARVHNLKNISVSLPHNKLTVITGVSGSGKSSLAFDTIYAEGQRRYVESLSAYARQFLERMDKPDVDEITGIAPAIAIRQKNSTRNPRSTVATQTEIYDYLGLLYARAGQTICHVCGREVKKDSPESAADEILDTLAEGTRFYVLFPILQGISGKTEKTKGRSKPKASASDLSVSAFLISLLQQGFSRLFRNGETIELQRPEDYCFDDFEDTFVLIDRLKASSDIRQRLVDSLETCFREGHAAIIRSGGALTGDSTKIGPGKTSDRPVIEILNYSDRFICKYDGTEYEIPEPQLFSFNSPVGACPTCQGFGNTIGVDYGLVIPNPLFSLKDGAIEPFTRPQHAWAQKELLKYASSANIDTRIPFADLPDFQQNCIIYGDEGWRGIKGFFQWLETKKYKLHVRVFLAKYRGYTRCPDCNGARLRHEARDVKIGGRSLPEILNLSIDDAFRYFNELTLTEEQAKIAEKLLLEVRRRLEFLVNVGLEYLSLDRLAATLSGGEAQRIQLATNLGSLLVGTLYVLDEPSIGLHPRDNGRLISILKDLRDIGNTVLVVEHDEETIRAADHIIDIGIYAGEHGGELVFEGTLPRLLKNSDSLTARYLRGDAEIKIPKTRMKAEKGKIRIEGAREHNLRDVTVDFPLGMLVAVTGVSGSGKSTLVHDVLFAGIKKQRGEWNSHVGLFRDITGHELIDDIVLVDQSPIGRTPRSNPVTYIKAYDAIRDVFAGTQSAKTKGYNSSHFSFNVPGGRCEICQGSGTVTVEMQFLADVELTCEVCRGTRFKEEILNIKYKGKSIAEALELTVREAIHFFKEVNKLVSRLKVLEAVGLGYLRLGQSATTLSGGEAQRVKLASYLSQKTNSKTLFVFDEPTTGLHFDDINKLLAAFRALLEAGASIIVIEHNMDVIKTADYVIDLGPEGGVGGGQIVAVGTPEEIAGVPSSHTGQFLSGILR